MAASTASRRSLFRHPNYAKLWTAATVSLFGTQISQVAIPFIAAVVLQASPGEVGLLTTIEFLPFILFTLPAGVWVDRFPKKRILVLGDLGRALFLLSIPIAAVFDVLTIWQLYVVGFVNGVMTVFFDVADQSFLPSILQRDELVEGNSKLQVSQSSAQILGQPVGGGLVALLSAPTAILIDAVSYVGSAFLILWIRSQGRRSGAGADPAAASASAGAPSSPSPAADPARATLVGEAGEAAPVAGGPSVELEAAAARPAAAPDSASMRSQIMDGLRFIGRHPFLANIAASTSTSNLFSNIAFAIFPVYLYRTLGLQPATVGAIGGIGGAGVLVGALIAGRVASRFGVGPTIVGSILFGAVMGLLVPLAPQDGSAFWFISIAFFAGSISNVIYNVNQVSLRQAITPDGMLGRMNATMRFLVWGTIPIGSLLGAGLSELIGVHMTIWVGAILGLFSFLPVLLSPVRSLRTIPTDDPDAAPAG